MLRLTIDDGSEQGQTILVNINNVVAVELFGDYTRIETPSRTFFVKETLETIIMDDNKHIYVIGDLDNREEITTWK